MSSSLPPPRFAKFDSANNNTSAPPAGLTRTPLRVGGAAAVSSTTPLPPPPVESHAAAAAATDTGGVAVGLHQRELAIKETAQRDKTILMNRIEDLSHTIHELQRRSSSQTEELESYHRAFGTLDDFTSRQVRVREELVVLRDAVRQWQDRESDARGECRRLEKVLDAVRRGQKHVSGESRLKDIEERLALAHLQRNDIAREIDDIVEMERAKRERHAVLLQRTAGVASSGGGDPRVLAAELAAAAPGVDGSFLNWQMRGKLADLKRLLRQKDESIESLQKAADSLQMVSRSDRFENIGAANRPCPGCNELPWKTAFCPETGARHLAFDPNVDKKKAEEMDNALRAPVFISLTDDDITARVDGWLESGEWLMLKSVNATTPTVGDSSEPDVLYRERATGRIVENLRAVVEQNHKTAHEERVIDYERQLKEEAIRREALELEAAKDPVPALAVQPSLKTEILNLTGALEEKKEENMRLRALLEAVCHSGSVGVKTDAVALAANMAGGGGGDDEAGAPPGDEQGGDDAEDVPVGSPIAMSDAHSQQQHSFDEQSPQHQQQQQAAGPSSMGQGFNPFGRSARVYPAPNDRAAVLSERRRNNASTIDGGRSNDMLDSALAAASGAAGAGEMTTTLHDEDDVQSYTKMLRLQRENAALGKRASELVLALVDRDDHIAQLREALDRNNAVENDRHVAQLRRESAQLRDRLLQEERRCANLEEEVRRLKRFQPKSFHQ